MRFKHISSLAFRLLAAYIAFMAIQYISMTARMSTPQMRNASNPRLPPWPNFAVPAALYVIGAALLFWYATRIGPKMGEEDDGPIEFNQIKSLAYMVLGSFFVISYLPLAVSDLLAEVATFMNRNPTLDRWITDVGCTLGGAILIVANAPRRETVPGFDEMTSQLKRLS